MQSTRNRLIHLLEEYKDTYISGQLLSEKLQISRNAVWKHMKELQKDGYGIEGIPKKGYRIQSYPTQLSENTLQWGLKTDCLGKNIIHKEVITSTQHLAHQIARENAAHGTVVIANEQTEGKGRMDRYWHSSKNKGIWMSIVLRPSLLPYLAPQLTLLTATVLADVIDQEIKVNPQIKWPNDILINGNKIAGILTEMQAEQDQIQYIVVGIGINVNHLEKDLPEEIKSKASSLWMETGQQWDIRKLIQQILVTFEQQYNAYLENGFENIKHKWEQYSFKIGKEISVRTLKENYTATFSGIAEDGALIVTTSDGSEKKLYSGEIDWFNRAD